MASPSKQSSQNTSRTMSKSQTLLNKDEADNIEMNKQALDLIIDMMQSVRGDQITSGAKEGLIRIHGLLRGIQMRDLTHMKFHAHTTNAPILGSAKSTNKHQWPLESKDSKSEEFMPLTSQKVVRSFKVPYGRIQTKEDVIAGFGYSIEKELDKGGFGTVYIVNDKRKRIKVACKWMDLGPYMAGSSIDNARNELLILEQVSHPYVIKLECYFMVHDPERYQIYIFMELANGGNLFKYLQKKGLPDELLCKKYFGQIVCGIKHMHNLSIAHRDMKPCNILLVQNERSISGDYLLKVSDFGLSVLVHTDTNGQVVLSTDYWGTPAYMSPELRAKRPYNPYLVDVYALGISLYEIFTLGNPFFDESKKEAESNALADAGKWQWPNNIKEPSKAMTELVQAMLEPDPAKRYSLDKVTFHSWAQSYCEVAHSRSNLFMAEHKQKHKLRQSECH